MRSQRWWFTGAPAVAGIVTGMALIVGTQEPRAIGQALFTGGLGVLVLALCKKWLTDTSFEKQRLHMAVLAADEERMQAATAHAVQLGERERLRSEVAEDKRKAAEAEQDANRRAEQAEINAGQRATQVIAEETARLKAEAAEQHALIITSSYDQGVQDALSGQIYQIAGPANIVHLDDRRPPQRGDGAPGAEGRSS